MDAPVILRGALTGFLALPTTKTSIGKVFQDRAARYGDQVFIRFGDEKITYREANETANRYAAVLAAEGSATATSSASCCATRPNAVLMMLAAVKCGAVAGMLNYHQRGDVLSHSIGLLSATVVVAESDLVDPIKESGADPTELVTLEEVDAHRGRPRRRATRASAAGTGQGHRVLHLHLGHHRHPKASVMTHHRWLRALAGVRRAGASAQERRHPVLPAAAVPQQRADGRAVVGDQLGGTLALGKSFSASRFWDDVIRYKATAFIYIGEVCRYLLNQPAKDTDRAHKIRVIAGNGLRPEIWDEFTRRFGIDRVVEFYAASEGNTAFINIFNIPKSTGISPTPLAYVEYDAETGEPARDDERPGPQGAAPASPAC